MSVSLFTQSIEDATITLTNGGTDSNSKLLQDRDLRTLGLNVASGSTTVTVHMDFGAAITVDYILFGNLTCSGATDIDVDYSDNDSDWTEFATDDDTYTNDRLKLTGTSASHRYWRVEFDRSAGAQTLTLGCIFMGAAYSFPVDYKYNNNVKTFERTEVMYDIYGYPYGQAIDTSQRKGWDVVFNLTKAQLINLATQLEYCNYNVKPMFIYDSNALGTSNYLVKYVGNGINAVNLAYDYFEVPLQFEEIR